MTTGECWSEFTVDLRFTFHCCSIISIFYWNSPRAPHTFQHCPAHLLSSQIICWKMIMPERNRRAAEHELQTLVWHYFTNTSVSRSETHNGSLKRSRLVTFYQTPRNLPVPLMSPKPKIPQQSSKNDRSIYVTICLKQTPTQSVLTTC